MRLRNPGAIDTAITTVQRVKAELSNARNLEHSAADRQDSFLAWCESWGKGQLGNHFPPEWGLFAEIDQAYHRVVLAPAMSERRLNGLLNREFSGWETRLSDVEATMSALGPFIHRPGRIVVPDTSALMEGVFFTHFNWHTLDAALAAEPVRLIVPALVLEELDDLKRHRDGRQKERARKVASALWELHRADPTEPAPLPGWPDVSIEVLLDDGWDERRPNNDAEIIDQAWTVRELTGQAVILAAGDYLQLYRAVAVGLAAVLMPRPDQAGSDSAAASTSSSGKPATSLSAGRS